MANSSARAAALPLRLLCPAKINLHLRVGPARSDGFHPLLSWMCTVGLFDELRLAPADGRAEAGVGVRLVCEPVGLPCDERNLVVRVASAWTPGAGAMLSAALRKRTPAGAGLGGGSSDAARMIRALDRLWPIGVDLGDWSARFGSDVPFFLGGRSAACSGRGEIVRPVAAPGPKWALLVLPELAMPTPDVYRRFDAMGLGRAIDLDNEPDWRRWADLDAMSLLPRLVNDLEAPAFSLRPELGGLRAGVERRLGRPVRMSGSGSSLFTLYDTGAEAVAAQAEAVAAQAEVYRRRAESSGAGDPLFSSARFEAVELAPVVDDDLGPD